MALEVLISSTNVTSEIETGKTGAFLSESGPQSSRETVYLRYTQNRLRLIWGISHRKQRSEDECFTIVHAIAGFFHNPDGA